MPRAAWKPPTSSAEVNGRTRITSSPASARSTASSALTTIAPLAAPGEAATPRVSFDRTRRSGSKAGCSSASSEDGSIVSQRLLAAEQALVDARRPRSGRPRARALRVAGLKDVEAPVLDRVLDVLHVAVVALERREDLEQLGVDLGHAPLEAVEILGVADPGDDVLALRVEQEVARRAGLPGRRSRA